MRRVRRSRDVMMAVVAEICGAAIVLRGHECDAQLRELRWQIERSTRLEPKGSACDLPLIVAVHRRITSGYRVKDYEVRYARSVKMMERWRKGGFKKSKI